MPNDVMRKWYVRYTATFSLLYCLLAIVFSCEDKDRRRKLVTFQNTEFFTFINKKKALKRF